METRAMFKKRIIEQFQMSNANNKVNHLFSNDDLPDSDLSNSDEEIKFSDDKAY